MAPSRHVGNRGPTAGGIDSGSGVGQLAVMLGAELRSAVEPSELAELAPVLAWAFNDTAAHSLAWLERLPLEQVRLLRRGARVIGGLVALPMGQWFGHASVPLLGLAGVAIEASERGTGLALQMLKTVLRDARARGQALSTLYPSNLGLYRKAGYELAGTHCRVELRLDACPRAGRELGLRDVRDDDLPAIERLYTAVARDRPGYLDRGAYLWHRVREYGGAPTRGVVVETHGELEGYLFAGKAAETGRTLLRLTDFVSSTPRATLRLLDFLGSHRATVERARWWGGPADLRLLALPDKAHRVRVDSYWMTRVVDVGRALEQRGYPELEAELELGVLDEFLPENSGTYRLCVSGGRARVERVERAARVRLDVRGLAALYTGFLTPHELARAGALEAEAPALSTLARFFSGTSPAASDYF